MKAGAVVLFLGTSLLITAASVPEKLWPRGAPGPKATTDSPRDTTTGKDTKPGGRPVIRLANVTEPDLTFYPAPKSESGQSAVVVFPGGGYRILATDLEGTEVCEWLNRIGVNAFLVRYRVPEPKGTPRYQQPLQDAQRAIGLVRSRAHEFGISPNRIGALGFSAGGHLLATLPSIPDQRTYPKQDGADDVSARPDFLLLIYPAYLSVEDKGEQLADEVRPRNTPPTFIVQTEDDKNFIGGTLLYYRALRDALVPAEIHVYTRGGHGYGLRRTADPVTDWPSLAEVWMRGLGALPANRALLTNQEQP